ncbi:MAG: asparagine--tRNA ligase, partial [Nitrospira sp.]|nr:asparagine--tRNA ligase [Nitrospira sp.]
MAVIYIEDVAHHVGQEATIRGWLRHRRSSGKIHFLVVRDGTGDLQAVVSKATVGEEQFAESAKLTQESSLVLTGTLRRDERAQGGYELDVTHIQPVQIAEPFPI